jgi:cytochrome P450
MPEIAPGPRGGLFLGNLPAFRRDVLGWMVSAAHAHGDVVRFRFGPLIVHLVNHPDHVTRVLQSHARQYDKNTRSTAQIGAICGESLLTANDEAWQRRRRLIQPTFHRQHIAQFARAMTDCIASRLDHWRTGQPVDMASEMMQITYTIVGKTILGADVSPESDAVERAIGTLLDHAYRRWGRILDLPNWLPTPGNRRFRRALAELDRVVNRIIAEHRATPSAGRDLLGILMEARDAESGLAFTDSDLRNETITMLLAGHETTANALSWTFALLAQHPACADRVRAEIASELGNRAPTMEDLPRLTCVTNVIRESMRLYPPIWAIERRAVSEDVIGGYRIPAGSSVIVSPYVLHRHPQFWPEPEQFLPERFDGVKQPEAYIPFGAGPRYCVGHEFAMMEARLIVVLVMQRFRLTLVPGHPIVPHPCITLRMKHGLRMMVQPVITGDVLD